MARAAAPDWLVARPIAHRGLHDAPRGLVENSCAAAEAAIARDYAIECDVRLTKDGVAIVFHDALLDRLTWAKGAIGERTAREIGDIAFRYGTEKIPLFEEFLVHIAGRAPLIVEIKSEFDGDMRLAESVVDSAATYPGPLALQTFDPAVLAVLRSANMSLPLGLIAQAHYDDDEWHGLSPDARRGLASLAGFMQAQPDFLAWNADDLPHAAATLWREALRLPLLAWTIKSAPQAAHVKRFADQIIFEDFEP